MTMYYMHVRDGTRLLFDLEGADFADDLEAVQAARQAARDMLGKMNQRGVESLGKRVEIETSNGRSVATVSLRSQLWHADDPIEDVILGGFSADRRGCVPEENAADRRRRDRNRQRSA